MPGRIVKRLPTVEEVEQQLSENAREARLLRSLRGILKRKQDRERAAARLRAAENRQGVADAK